MDTQLIPDFLNIFLVNDQYTFIGVHIRHGSDVVGKTQHTDHGQQAVTKEYVLHAVDHFRFVLF